jgi:CBS-domain-containing membrane protein
MKARDLMTSDVVAVPADATVQEIARLLLDHQLSGAPVVDAGGAPIGMVSDGDLIGPDEPQRQARRRWWLGLLAEGEAAGGELLASLRARQHRTASEIMSRPVVTVGEDADAAEVARLLLSYRIKRAPVVRHGKVVGIISREDLLGAVAEQKPPAVPRVRSWLLPAGFAAMLEHARHPDGPSAGAPAPDREPAVVNVADFRRLVNDYESKEQQQRDAARRGMAEQHRRDVEDLIDRHISDEAWRQLVHQAREAAERGEKESLLLRFPSELCSDGGRAVNAPEPDWPATLRGEAGEIYLRWERDLKPHGFRIAARVIDFPGGMPGDIGLFLSWRE